jgi:hypothetical protein
MNGSMTTIKYGVREGIHDEKLDEYREMCLSSELESDQWEGK